MTDQVPVALTEELEEARRVQMAMLPQAAPDIPGFEIAAHIAPAFSVGGDFYDFIALPGDRLGIVFGDAVGHGIASALLMSMTLANFRFVAPVETKPQTVIEHINHHLCLTKGVSQSSSVAAAYAVLDWANASVSCSGMGAREMIEAVLQDVQEFVGDEPQRDDINIVIVKRLAVRDDKGSRVSVAELSGRVIQSMLVEVDSADLAVAMLGLDDAERDAIYRNMSPASTELVRQDMEERQDSTPESEIHDAVELLHLRLRKHAERARTQRPVLANELLIKTLFQYQVSPRVIDRLVREPSLFQLEPAERDATVLFSDLRAATRLFQELGPRDMYALLNEYFETMVQIILDNEGFLDKFVGDEIMAMWGAPLYREDHAYLACKAALEMQQTLNAMRSKWRREGRPEIRAGVGVNSALMAVGLVGAKSKMNYTPFGSHVNLAARLEGTNKLYVETPEDHHSGILISEFTHEMVKDRVITREIDTILLSPRARTELGGRSQVTIYELVALREPSGHVA